VILGSISTSSQVPPGVQLCRAPLKNKKARWPFATGRRPKSPKETSLALEAFAPIQRIGPPLRIFWLVEPIARPDEVVGGDEIIGGVGIFGILFLDPERRQDGRDGPEHDGVDVVVMQPSLFGECFRDNRPDLFVPPGLIA
jgi:hypothetical protein